MADLYDLIFLGVNADTANRETTISRISALLGVDAKEIEYLLDNQLSAALKQGIPLEAVRQYKTEMEQLGGVCNYRPSKWEGHKLELAPVEIRPEEFVFSCPACEHRQTVTAEADLPTSCPACGIIPSKYEKVSNYKQGRGMGAGAKPSLPPNVRNLREPPPQELAGQQGGELRQALQFPQPTPPLLLANAWPEPAAPKAARSPLARFATGALLWLLGAAMGGGAVSAYYELRQREVAQSPAPPQEPTPAPDTSTPLPADTPSPPEEPPEPQQP